MKVYEIAGIIESFAPKTLAMEYDNVGLIIGNYNCQVEGILACVDITKAVVKQAIEVGANLIISHHPIIFHPIKCLVDGDYNSEIILLAIKNNINIYAAHTNIDSAPYGINYRLAKAIGGSNIDACFEDGIGVAFEIRPQLISSLRDDIGTILCDGNIRLYLAGQNELITRCALICGAGGRDSKVYESLFKKQTQVFITSELANNVRIELQCRGISIIECSHHESERVFCDIIEELLAECGQKVLKYKRI